MRADAIPQTRVRSTVTIPANLLEAVDRAISEGFAKSRNEFLAMALRNQLVAFRRTAIDAAFAGMATDPDYQREATATTRAFETADWEALAIAEGRS